MTRLLIELGGVGLVTYWISSAMNVPFWIAAAVVVGLYFVIFRGWRPAAVPAFGVRATGGGSGNMPVNVIVWLGVMLLGTAFIAFSNAEAFVEIVKIGWRPWLWPGGMLLKFLMWVCLAFIAGSAATPNASPRPWARKIFGLGFLILFTIEWMPQQAEAIRPRPSNPAVSPSGGSPSKWDEADKAAAEIGDIPTIFCVAWQKAWGPLGYCGSGKTVGVAFSDAVGAIKGATAQTPADTTTFKQVETLPATVTTPTSGLKATEYPFDENGCYERELGYEARWAPVGGKSMIAYDPAGKSHEVVLGQKPEIFTFGPGKWRFCKGDDPATTGVMIWG